jgi:hypothetical protein
VSHGRFPLSQQEKHNGLNATRMSELLESISQAVVMDQHDDECYFCNAKKEPTKAENDCVDSPDDDSYIDGEEPDGIKFKNDAGKLGAALGGTPDPRDVTFSSKNYAVSVAAHHLIPGNAALKKSTLFTSKKYLWTDGEAMGNIGYNVNSKPNGEWLPGNYAMRPWGSGGAAFETNTKVQPKAYAFAAIEVWRGQFHDAHEDYSSFVKDVLDKIHDKLLAGQEIWCPKAKKEDPSPDKKTPLYVLVNRLHTVSARMRRMLVFPASNWKKNIFTSAFSLDYMNEKKG